MSSLWCGCSVCIWCVCVGDQVKLLYCEAVPSEVGIYHVVNLRTKEEGKVPLHAVDFIVGGELLRACVRVCVLLVSSGM